jgi:hypothetical protein
MDDWLHAIDQPACTESALLLMYNLLSVSMSTKSKWANCVESYLLPVIERLLRILRQRQNERYLSDCAIDCLLILTTYPSVRQAIVESGITQAIIKDVFDLVANDTHKKDPRLAEGAVSIFLNMTASDDVKIRKSVLDELCTKEDIIEKCTHLAIAAQDASNYKALSLVSRICQYSVKAAAVLIKWIPRLVQNILHKLRIGIDVEFVTRYSELSNDERKLIDSLMRCVTACAAVDASFVSDDIICYLLLPILRIEHSGRVSSGNAALIISYVIAKCDDHKFLLIHNNKGVESLVDMIKKTERDDIDIQVQKNAAIALAGLAKHDPCRQTMRDLDAFKVIGQKSKLLLAK